MEATKPVDVHRFYQDRKRIETIPCKTCGEPIIKDRWVKGGYAHAATARVFCDPAYRMATP